MATWSAGLEVLIRDRSLVHIGLFLTALIDATGLPFPGRALLVAAGAMLAEPSVDSQVRALAAKTPVVTVRQITARAEQPDTRFTIEVVAKRDAGRVS